MDFIQSITLIICYLQAYAPIRGNGKNNILNFLQNLAIAQNYSLSRLEI